MALPVINTPTYQTVVPSSEEKVKYRPFLVKEEKALLIAQQSEDLVTMVDTLKSVIKSCTFGKLDVDTLAIFDLEYLFTQIRSKSVGETISLLFGCDNCGDDPKAKVKITIDLSSIKVDKPEGHQKNIQLFDDVGVIMKYPTIDVLKDFQDLSTNDVESIFKIVCKSIDCIYTGEEVYYAKEQKPEELEEFVNNLTQDQFAKLQQFFETMPKLRHGVKYTCPVCGTEHEKSVEGLDAFFT